jgi:hypothetical protein
MCCLDKLIRTCSVSLIHYSQPQSAVGAHYTCHFFAQRYSALSASTPHSTPITVLFGAPYAGTLPEVSSSPEDVSFDNLVSSLLQLKP